MKHGTRRIAHTTWKMAKAKPRVWNFDLHVDHESMKVSKAIYSPCWKELGEGEGKVVK